MSTFGSTSSNTMSSTTTIMNGNSNGGFMSIKQAIAGPAPPQSYAKLVRAVLRYRQKRVYALSFASVAILLPLAAFPVAGFDTFFALLYPTVWLFLLIGFTGTLPVFVARKQFLSTTRPAHGDRYSQYYNLVMSGQARWTLVAYWLSAAVTSFAYVCIVSWLAPSRSYLYLVRTPGRDLLQINERFVYVCLAVLSSTTAYAVKQILASRQTLHFSSASAPIPVRLQNRLSLGIATIPALAGPVNLTLLGLYLLFRRTTLRFIIYRIPGGRVLRPYLMSMLRHTNLAVSVILSGLCASAAVLVILEFANSLADVYYSQPVGVSAYSSEPRRSLVDGLQSSEAYIRRFAYLELREVTTTDEKRRKEIFADLKGSSFEGISKECLRQLGTSYRTLQRRGQAKAAASNSSAPGPPQSSSRGASRLPISSEPAFRPVQRTFLDQVTQAPEIALAALSSTSQTVTDSSAAHPIASTSSAITRVLPQPVLDATSTAVAKVPTIFQRQVANRAPESLQHGAQQAQQSLAEAKQKVEKAQQQVQKIEQTLLEKWHNLTPDRIKTLPYWRYLFEPQVQAQVSRCLPDADLDCWAATSLAALLMASLHEDQYGVAQGDIPKVLEAFILYLGMLESYAAELNALADDGKLPTAAVRQQVSEHVQPLIDTLRDSITGILHTFSAYLDDLRFPPTIARRLQDML